MVNIVLDSVEIRRKKKICDLRLMSKLAYSLYIYKMSPSVRAVEKIYLKEWGTPIPYEDFNFPDVISYLQSVPALVVFRNPVNNRYHVSENPEEAQHFIPV